MKYITPENLSDFAFLNDDTLTLPLRGICVCFHGFTDSQTFQKSGELERYLGEKGIAWVWPYYDVWAWMSKNSCAFNEQVIDAVYEKLAAPEDIPLVICGGSMGGMTALNYVRNGKRKAVACAVNCPVLDIEHFYNEAHSLRRPAILQAHIEREESLEDIMKYYSPIYFAGELPKIPYYFVFGSLDHPGINDPIEAFDKKMSDLGHDYKLTIKEGMRHCAMSEHKDIFDEYHEFIINAVMQNQP